MKAEPARIVLAPDVLAHAFMDPPCKAVVDCWRDGTILPVITWDLLQRYLRVLRKLGLPDTSLRKWTLWFTARGKTVCVLEPRECAPATHQGIVSAVAAGKASIVLTSLPPPDEPLDASWQSPAMFLQQFAGME